MSETNSKDIERNELLKNDTIELRESDSPELIETDTTELIETNTTELIETDTTELIEKQCRICLESDNTNDLIAPCLCSGTSKYVHRQCLDQWRAQDINGECFFKCNECQENYQLGTSTKKCSNILMFISKFLSTQIFWTFIFFILILQVLYFMFSELDPDGKLISSFLGSEIKSKNDEYYLLSITVLLGFISTLLIIHECYIFFNYRNYSIYCKNYATIGLFKFSLLVCLNLFLYIYGIGFVAVLVSTILINLITKHISQNIYNYNRTIENPVIDLDTQDV